MIQKGSVVCAAGPFGISAHGVNSNVLEDLYLFNILLIDLAGT